jgi:hypothetical protein
MKKSLAFVLVAVSMLSISALAQWGVQVNDVLLYWQPDEKTVVFDPACPYMYVRPDMDQAAVMNNWLQAHENPDGSLIRPTAITLSDLAFLDIFFGDNDLVAFWHQIVKCGGPISTIQTLSKMKTISLTRTNPETGGYPEPSWTCSLGEYFSIAGFFDLSPGTSDGQLPDRYQQ